MGDRRSWLPTFPNRSVLLALVAGCIIGIGLTATVVEFEHYAGSEEFCTSCHSMTSAAEAYRQSAHYLPASGVRATCGDCHVSPGLLAGTWDHLIASRFLFLQWFGPDFDDPVVNALHRPDAAFRSRDWFVQTASHTCRNCHVAGTHIGSDPGMIELHSYYAEEKTCIECHANLVHEFVPELEDFDREAWNREVEARFELDPGTADSMLAAVGSAGPTGQ